MRCDKAPISCLWEGIWSSGDILFICAAFEEGDLGDHDFVEYTYYLDGCVATMTDQRCVVHTYQYDVNGRQVSDAVTTLPDGVDGSVRRIDRAYDDQGRLQRVTSYDSPSGGTAVNEVRYDYDAWGDLLAIWQAHDGNVTASSPKLGYAYETSVSGQSMSFIRRAGVTLPSGRSLAYDYAGTVNTALSRLAGVKDAATQATLAAFTYLGASTIVGESRPSVGLGYTLVGEYGGLDALGRVTELYWKVGGEFIDDFCYGYDAAGNRTWRAQYDGDSGAEVHDEAYQYDGLNRLTETRRGTLDWDDFTITDPTSS
jgi:hypothetical protein